MSIRSKIIETQTGSWDEKTITIEVGLNWDKGGYFISIDNSFAKLESEQIDKLIEALLVLKYDKTHEFFEEKKDSWS